ncbi:MAG: hypothetical protein QM610_07015 [Chitinophagaceae bacterium]
MRKTNSRIYMVLAFLSGCATKLPQSSGYTASGYGYNPLDPLPINIDTTGNRQNYRQRVLNALPDESIRLAIGHLDYQGKISFSTASMGYEDSSYVVILDYIKFNTQSIPVKKDDSETSSGNEDNKTVQYRRLTMKGNDTTPQALVPVYIGIGLRLTANVTVKKGAVDLGNLFGIGASGSAKQVSGTLIVQTLGVSGQNISAIIPMPSELNETSVQNAIMALATIKSHLYDSTTLITPRVVGVYNNLGGGTDKVNGFITSILKTPLSFVVP